MYIQCRHRQGSRTSIGFLILMPSRFNVERHARYNIYKFFNEWLAVPKGVGYKIWFAKVVKKILR